MSFVPDLDMDPVRATSLATVLGDTSGGLTAAKGAAAEDLSSILPGSSVPGIATEATDLVSRVVEGLSGEFETLSKATSTAIEALDAVDGDAAQRLRELLGVDL